MRTALAVVLPPTTTTTPTTSTTTTTTTIADGPVVNGCDPHVADDHRGEAEVVVEFGRDLDIFDYAPECIAVSRGAKVRFEGSFGIHPLVGGEVVGGVEHPDPASPFGQVRSGATASFVMTLPGVYGYYCDEHSVLLMYGAVVVVP